MDQRLFYNLNVFVDAIFSVLTQVFNLYTTSILLTGVLALWLLRKVANIFHKL